MGDIARWGDFEIHFDGELGRGGMGTVYRAWQASIGRWVAVKVLEPSRAGDPELQQGFLQKFQVEIQALARLNDPRIVTIHQAGNQDGRLWFAMELIDGVTVEKRLSEKGAFPEREARRVGIEVARALEAALRQGIIHRDVKPANIFLLKDGSVKLADFGLARSDAFGRTRLTDLQAVACTPEYASPEQADGRPTDHRSDLYSLGCVLYEMVTERPPFNADSPLATLYQHASSDPPSSRELNPAVSSKFEALVQRCLEKEPADRFQSYGELIDALAEEPVFVAESEPPRRNREWIWTAAAAAGVTLLGVILTAIFTAEAPAIPPARQAAPGVVRVEPLEVPLRPAARPEEDPPAPVVKAPVSEPPPLPVPAKAPLDKPPERDLGKTLEAFRAALGEPEESELVGQIPWGTWAPSPAGEANYDPATRGYRLTARGERDRVWIQRRFSGARAGYQIRFRFLSEGAPRFAVAVNVTRWLEVTPGGLSLYRVEPDDAERRAQAIEHAEALRGGLVTVLPGDPGVLIFLDDRLVLALAEPDFAPDKAIQLGASGGSVLIESIRVKDRTP